MIVSVIITTTIMTILRNVGCISSSTSISSSTVLGAHGNACQAFRNCCLTIKKRLVDIVITITTISIIMTIVIIIGGE